MAVFSSLLPIVALLAVVLLSQSAQAYTLHYGPFEHHLLGKPLRMDEVTDAVIEKGSWYEVKAGQGEEEADFYFFYDRDYARAFTSNKKLRFEWLGSEDTETDKDMFDTWLGKNRKGEDEDSGRAGSPCTMVNETTGLTHSGPYRTDSPVSGAMVDFAVVVVKPRGWRPARLDT